MLKSVFERYPELRTLRGLVPDALVEREVSSRAEVYEMDLKRARQAIPTVNLGDVFGTEMERAAIALDHFLGHWGNVTVEELCKICLIVRLLAPKRILEIGTYNGMTTLQMALNAPEDGVVYTLDLPKEVVPRTALSSLDAQVSLGIMEKFKTETGSYFRGHTAEQKIRQLWGDSETFDYAVLGGPADLIFIDAAHDYHHKKIDSQNAFNLLTPGGVILWHDYGSVCNPDVTRYLADLSKERKLFHLRNTHLVLYQAGRSAGTAGQ